jgi:trans-aconitate 2-methyltransferase
MVAEARRRLARFGARVTYVVADLAQPLPIERPVDAILSTATFHWVLDHDALFRNLAAILRPGGRLVAQCGGVGNIARVTAIAESLGGQSGGRRFETPEATAERLRAAGFEDVDTWLTPEPTRLEAGEPLEAYLRTVCLRDYLPGASDEERDAFIRTVAQRLGEPVIDYVRLNIQARRAADG